DAGLVFAELDAELRPECRKIEARAPPDMRLGQAPERVVAGGGVADRDEAFDAPARAGVAAPGEHGLEAIGEALGTTALLDDLGVGEQHHERSAPIDGADAARCRQALLLHRRHALAEIAQEAAPGLVLREPAGGDAEPRLGVDRHAL